MRNFRGIKGVAQPERAKSSSTAGMPQTENQNRARGGTREAEQGVQILKKFRRVPASRHPEKHNQSAIRAVGLSGNASMEQIKTCSEKRGRGIRYAGTSEMQTKGGPLV